MNKGTRFSALMMIIGLSTIIFGVQLLFSLDGMSPGRYHCFYLVIYGPICYLINALFLRREKTLNLTVLINGLFSVIFLTILFIWFGTGGGKQAAATIGFCLLVTYYAVRVNLNPPKDTLLILFLDISVVLMILLVVVMNTMERSYVDMIPLAAGCVCLLFGLMRYRLHSIRLWGIPIGLLLILSLVYFVLMTVAGYIGMFLTVLFGGVVSGLKYIGTQIEGFLLYLTSFMQDGSFEEINAEAFGISSGAMETAQQFQDGLGIIIGLIILAFFIFVLIMALRSMGKSGIGGKKLNSVKFEAQQAPSFFTVFQVWLRALKERLHYSILVIKRRNTPWGLFYLLRFVTGNGKYGMKAGETPRIFLLRLSESLPKTGHDLIMTLPEIEKALFRENGNPIRLRNTNMILREVIMIAGFRR